MWYNVDNIVQRIESKIDFITHKTDLYDLQFFSEEDEDCLFQSSHCIRGWIHVKKSLGVVYGFKYHYFLFIYVSLCWNFVISPEGKSEIYTTTIWQLFLPLSKNIIFKGRQILYPLKQKDFCDYNPIFIMSSNLMFD